MPNSPADQHQPLDRLLRRSAYLAAVFALVVAALLMWDFSKRQAKTPLDSRQFLALKSQLAKQPRSDELKETIRRMDLDLRQRYFRQRRFAEIGAWLLFITAIVFFVTAKWAASHHRKLPTPQPQGAPPDYDEQLAHGGRRAIAALVVALSLLAVVLGLTIRSDLPPVEQHLAAAPPATTTAAAQPATAAPAAPAPTAVANTNAPSTETDLAKQWPRFRGPGGRGVAPYSDVPTQWNASTGQNILWKTPVPLPGNNSPVVCGDRIFLSGADEEKREVYCFDAASGKLLWQKQVPGTPQSTAEPPEVSPDTGFAAPTMATDGRLAFAIFANGDVAAFDYSGNLVWSRSLGIPKSTYGHAASLLVFQNLLLVPFDQGAVKDKLSKLLALDTATGKTVWEAHRDVPCSWPTPILIEVQGKTQVITAADPWVIAYDARDGHEVWRAKCLRQDVGPSPTFANGVVYAVNEFPGLAAIRADGQGDVTKTHILWKGEEGLPDTASPLATDKYVFLLSSAGTLTAYDAKTGDMLWQEDFDSAFNSSPSLCGNRIYLFGTEGKCWVIEPNPNECKIVAESDLAEDCVTSPAFQPGRMYIRGRENLYCIASP